MNIFIFDFLNKANGHFHYLISHNKFILFQFRVFHLKMFSISSQQAQLLSKQNIKINDMATNQDVSILYLDFPSNNLRSNQNMLASIPNNYHKTITQGMNPVYNNYHNESSSQFHPTSSNFPFSNPPKIAPSSIPQHSIQPTLFSSKQHKTKWTYDEDVRLIEAVDKFGTDSWIRISQFVPGRNSKQCRERWMGQLAPTIRKDSWSHEEDEILMHQHDIIGNKWTTIATFLPGRSAINVKNRWSKIKRFKDDFLVGGISKSSSSTQDQFFDNNNNNFSQNSDYSENPSSNKSTSTYNKRNNHKSSRFKHSKFSNSVSRKQNKGRKNVDYLYNTSDEVTIKSEISQPQNNENIAVIKEKLPGIVFEFPTIDNVPLFGQDFAQFQAQMLK